MRSVAEHKYLELDHQFIAGGAFPPINTGQMSLVSAVPQGIGDNMRVGDKCTGTSIQMNAIIYSAESDAIVTDMFVRCTIFIWKDDTPPTQGDLYDVPAGPWNIFPPIWHFNHDKKVKRRIIYDRTWNLYSRMGPGAAKFAVGRNNAAIKLSFPLTKYGKDATINFQAAALAGVNNIYMIWQSNATIVAATPNIYCITRYNYIDM